jgi:hypothetical protein
VTDTETRLREAMRTATAASPEPIGFDLIRRRVRRRRRHSVVAAGVLVAVAATTPVWATQLGSEGEPGQPSRSGGPTTTPPEDWPEGVPPPSVIDPDVVQEPWTADRWHQLPWSTTALPRVLDPFAADTTSLAADPVGRALAAVQPYSDSGRSPIYLLGEDDRWRVQDLVEVKPTLDADRIRGTPMGVGALSADGTKLALPQPHELIVIDLTTNTARHHRLPGLHQEATWLPDGHQVLLSSVPYDSWRNGHYRKFNVVVDVESGSWERVPYDQRFTSYADDGTPVVAHQADSRFSYELRRYEPDGDMEPVPMAVDVFEDSRAILSAGSDAVVVMRDVVSNTIPRPAGAWPGPTVLDIDSGEALAQLPTRGFEMLIKSYPLGWVDEDTALLWLDDRLVAWDYESGELRRVTRLVETGGWPYVSIATALVEADD